MSAHPLFVVVSGPPASGKSTVAPTLAAELRLPLVAKDTIKDALLRVLPVPDVAASRALGRASVVAMLAVAAESPVGAVIESAFHRSRAVAEVAALPGRVVEVFCACDPGVGAARYRARAGSRHTGHFDHQRDPAELWNDDVARPVGGGWPVLRIDTNGPFEPASMSGLARAVLGAAGR
jgi:predicted kinase